MSSRVLLGITGGIAAYKTPWLVRLLVESGMEVHAVMTRAATQFVTPLTLATVSGNRVEHDMWEKPFEPQIEHITLADQADIAVIAPATANIIGKMASGIADDLLTTMFMALKCPALICPSMNVNMFRNPVVQRNLNTLRELGYHVLDPASGYLACGWVGEGRLPEPECIVQEIRNLLAPRDLEGEKVLVTAGPTEEPLDPVRFLTNRSSGKMGVAVAARALARGADVMLVAGPISISVPEGLKHIPVRTAQEMHDRVMEVSNGMSVIVKAAAVADFRPAMESVDKIKKEVAEPYIPLAPNPDILKALGDKKPHDQILVGFAAETGNTVENGRKKLSSKNLDLLVVNDVTRPGAGFDYDTNIVRFLHRSGLEEEFEIMPKMKVADLILDRVRDLRKSLKAGGEP
ncbi:MAG: bifunctional phosphopantothenoylcysteine decarboxylase/phosphopantothenate--cysteine ligase CoaBC [Thermodesulfobacteriota bacterium]